MAGDIVFYPIANNPAPVEVFNFGNPPNPLYYTDTIHLSHGVDVTIRDSGIVGGREDCIDMNNNSERVTVQDVTVQPNGLYGFTIKGGTKTVHLKNVTFFRHGTTTDIDLGNWSDQNTVDKTRGVILENVTSADGTPVRVRVLFADNPTVIGGNVKLVVYPSWLVWLIRKFHNHI